MHETPKSFQCRHIRTSGRRCGSPSLRGEHLCFYHANSHRSAAHRRSEAHAIAVGYPIQPSAIEFESLEDRPSIQLALLDVLNRIGAGTIDNKRAGMLLYGLQIASNNLPPEPRPARAAPSKTAAEPARSESGYVPELMVEDLTEDPEFGTLAPIAEVVPPEQEDDRIDPITGEPRPSDMVERFLYELHLEQNQYVTDQAAIPACAHCGRGPTAPPAPIPIIQAVAA